MAILSQSRTSVFIFLLTLSSGMSQSNADEIQSLLRYLGAGWGAGYHSYGTASTARTAHGFRCNDRYSRPANFGCIDCGGYQRGQGFAGNDGHYQGGYPQGYVSPTTDGRSRNHLGPTYTPRDDPHAPQDDLQPALPPLQPVTPDQEAIPKTNGRSTLPLQNPPANSGSSQNPFGVTFQQHRNYKSVPARTAPSQMENQPRYQSVWPIRQLKHLGNQNLGSANNNRIQATSNQNNQVLLSQRSSIFPRPPQQLNRNQLQANQLTPQNTVRGFANQQNANQQRPLREDARPYPKRSNVYRGIR